MVKEVLDDFNMTMKNIYTTTTDNGANMVRLSDLMDDDQEDNGIDIHLNEEESCDRNLSEEEDYDENEDDGDQISTQEDSENSTRINQCEEQDPWIKCWNLICWVTGCMKELFCSYYPISHLGRFEKNSQQEINCES